MNVFDQINDVIMESSMAVYDAMLDIINKRETINDNDPSTEFDNIITESFQIFVEYVSKDKDEITKWMDKKGYFYTGDNPKKKKECLRMYNFLKQHDFRPSDETYRSDIKENGTNKRIKLIIDPSDYEGLTDDDKKLLDIKFGSPEYKKMSDDEKFKYLKFLSNRDLHREIRKGENASANYNKNTIKIGSKELKGKQYHSQQTLKHEEGHIESRGRNKKLPEQHPANVALKEHKDAGKGVNNHDNSTEELMADLYSAMHGRIRTKNWGKNKTTRALTKNDIERSFNKLHEGLDDKIRVALEETYSTDNKNEILQNIKTNISKLINEWVCRKQDDCEGLFREIEEIVSDEFFVADGRMSDSFSNKVKSNINKNNDIRYDVNSIKRQKASILDAKKIFADIKQIFKNYNINSPEDIDKLHSDMESSGKYNKELLNYIFKYTNTADELIDNIKDEMEYRINKIKECKNNIKQLCSETPDDPHVKRMRKILNEGYEKAKLNNNKFPEAMLPKLMAEIQMFFEDFMKNIDKNEEIKKLRKMHKESHELRVKFAQSAIKEYFEDFIDDLIYND